MKKTKHNATLDMILEYPRVFDVEGKPGDLDRGDPKAQAKWLRELAKNPEAKVNAYFESEEQITFLEDFEGFDRFTTNPQTGDKVDRIKEGNEEFGIGKYIQLKRKLEDLKEFADKSGQIKELDKGGAPSVKILTPEGNKFVEYSYEELGAPANGTKAKVRFEPKYMRLEALGITELIEYTDEEHEEDDF